MPEPSARPGFETDFSYLHLAPAGAAKRPAVDVQPRQTSELAFSLIRVLDDEGRALGPWDPKLSPESLSGEAQVLPELAKTLTRRGFLGHVTNSNKKNMAMFPGRLTLWMVTKGNH